MLLTNQKTINYENLYKIKGNHSFYFVEQRYLHSLHYYKLNINFNTNFAVQCLFWL